MKKIKKRQKTRKTLLFISFLFFPATFYYLSPYLIIDGTIKGVITGSFLFFVLLFVSSLLVGRAFCGWVCPAGGAQESILTINSKKITKGNLIKWIIWIPWMSAIVALAIKNGGYQSVDLFYQTTFGFSIGNVFSLIIYLLVLMLIVAPALIFGRRSFCHSICWMAPFMMIGRKLRNLLHLPSLQLASDSESCMHCHSCTTNCPMSLPVEDMVVKSSMENSECILCGECVDGCNSGSIRYEFKRPIKK